MSEGRGLDRTSFTIQTRQTAPKQNLIPGRLSLIPSDPEFLPTFLSSQKKSERKKRGRVCEGLHYFPWKEISPAG